jgi:hippurate hydrolase
VPEDRAPVFEHLKEESVPATYNEPKLTERLAQSITKELGEPNVVLVDSVMVSEDFGLFGLDGKIPTSLLALGAGSPASIAAGTQPGLHSSKFAPNDPSLVLRTGVRAAVSGILGLLER